MENINDGYINIQEKTKSINPELLVFYCQETLPFDEAYNEVYYRHVRSHAVSKYSHFLNCDFSIGPTENNGIVCLTTKNESLVKLHSDKLKYSKDFILKRFDVLMFPDYFNVEYTNSSIKKTIYSIKNKEIPGNGSDLYEVSLVLSDLYKMQIYANSEQDAIDQSYKIGLTYFEHVFDRSMFGSGYEFVAQTTRGSIWHKGMMEAKKI